MNPVISSYKDALDANLAMSYSNLHYLSKTSLQALKSFLDSGRLNSIILLSLNPTGRPFEIEAMKKRGFDDFINRSVNRESGESVDSYIERVCMSFDITMVSSYSKALIKLIALNPRLGHIMLHAPASQSEDPIKDYSNSLVRWIQKNASADDNPWLRTFSLIDQTRIYI